MTPPNPPSNDQFIALVAPHIKRLLVPFYRNSLAPAILLFLASGKRVDCFNFPPSQHVDSGPKFGGHSITFGDWLFEIGSFFNERAYLSQNPDVADAVNQSIFRSGYEHFSLHGQFEGRHVENYFSGTAEFDCILLDIKDIPDFSIVLHGRLQPYQKIIFYSADKECQIAGTSKPEQYNNYFLYRTPPESWQGPAIPTTFRSQWENWPGPAQSGTAIEDNTQWPKISIITPTFNQGNFIEETIQSVINQGYPNLEYIIIDGGSKDNTREVIKKYSHYLAYQVSEKDSGQSNAINKGFKKSTGEILTWLNSDDLLAPGALHAIAEAFKRHKPDIVVGRCARIQYPYAAPHHYHSCKLTRYIKTPLPLDRLLNLEESWQQGDFFHQPEVFFTRSIWERAGAHVREDLFYSMDYDLWVRYAEQGAQALCIPEIVSTFRQHSEQKTGGAELPFLPELKRVNQSYRQKLSKT
jgi:GT2 family glycosyltransferase